MKKTIFLLFMLSCGLLTAIGCNGSESKSGNTASTSAEDKNVSKDEPKVIHLTKAEFLKKVADYEKNSSEWKYLGDKPAIVDFYADWCGPCKRLAPVLDELAKEYKGQIVIYKVNTDKEKELAQAFGIKSLPTLFFIPMEGKPQVAQGALPKDALIEAINEVLLKK